ncbi:MAG TPA: zf-HC2 domain-containing protein [Pyrinomonadaceae bacterium]|jgi:hypothetical protein
MKCTRVEKFLPLHVADDLTSRRRRAIENHLAACEKCRLVADEYHASRELFRAATLSPDFDGAFYEEIRTSVLAQIRRDRTLAPPSRFSGIFNARLAYAASLAVIVIAAALALHSYTRRTSQEGAPRNMMANVNGEHPATRPAAVTPQTIRPGGSERQPARKVNEPARPTMHAERRMAKSPLPKPDAALENARTGARRASNMPSRTPSNAGRNPPAPTIAATNAPPEFSRIEIQTSDPNIRIIWLSSGTEDTARPLK